MADSEASLWAVAEKVGGLIVVVGGIVMAAALHDQTGWLALGIVAIVLGSLVAIVGFVGPLATARRRRAGGVGAMAEQSDRPQTVVFSINQQGGQTAQTIVNNAPAPRVVLGGKLAENQQDATGRYHNVTEITVETPYPAANLYVEAHAPSVESVEMTPQERGGTFMTGNAGKRDGWAFNNLQSPMGRIHADVVSVNPEPRVELVWRVE